MRHQLVRVQLPAALLLVRELRVALPSRLYMQAPVPQRFTTTGDRVKIGKQFAAFQCAMVCRIMFEEHAT